MYFLFKMMFTKFWIDIREQEKKWTKDLSLFKAHRLDRTYKSGDDYKQKIILDLINY